MMQPLALAADCDALLDSEAFDDYAPNGLQVEGERPIRRLVTGVTASAALIEAACQLDADALLVHHGWFWRNEPAVLTGIKGRRVRTLIKAGMSLFAYHLPLDAHPRLGNNIRLAEVLGIAAPMAVAGAGGLLWQGHYEEPLTPRALAARAAERLGRPPILIPGGPDPIRRLAWCTGAGQSALGRAAALGVDAFISGEISEQTTHEAREYGISFLAVGHHASERYGIQALGEHLAARHGFAHDFIDIDNPA